MFKLLSLVAMVSALPTWGAGSDGFDVDWFDDDEAASKSWNAASNEYLARAFGGAWASGPRLGVVLDEEDNGLQVQAVTPGSAAEEAGLKAGDVLRAVDGETLTTRGAHRRLLRKVRAAAASAKALALEVLREGKTMTVSAKIPKGGNWKSGESFPGFATLASRMGRLDLELTSLNEDLGAYFGSKEGVLVLRAGEGPLSLKGGDVLLKVGDRAPKSPMNAMRILRSYEPGERITLEVRRQQKVVVLNAVIPGAE